MTVARDAWEPQKYQCFFLGPVKRSNQNRKLAEEMTDQLEPQNHSNGQNMGPMAHGHPSYFMGVLTESHG